MPLRITGKVTLSDIDQGFLEQLQQSKGAVDDLLNDVAKQVFQEAKRTSAFVDRTGNLRKSIRKRKSKFPDGGYIVIATGRNRGREKGFHAHLVEFGHVKVLWGRRTNERVPPYPFMRPALEKARSYLMSKISGSKK